MNKRPFIRSLFQLALGISLFSSLISCQNKVEQYKTEKIIEQTIGHQLNDPIQVIAHRGDWRNAPENSLPAIESCIAMGVDMVEVDVRMTKDSVLVLMHDETIDRTTKGKGKVIDYTYEQLSQFYLLDGIGVETPYKIPTLEEALLLCKDNILVNLDKSYAIIDQCIAVAKQTNTLKQLVFKGKKAQEETASDLGSNLAKIHFMPIVNVDHPEANTIVKQYLDAGNAYAFELIIPTPESNYKPLIEQIKQRGGKVWINSLWDNLNANHGDERAVVDQSVYDWYIELGADYIQTDRPQLLINYLDKRVLR